MHEEDKALDRFRTWSKGLSATKARETRLFGGDPPLKQPGHVNAQDVVSVFLQLYPAFSAHKEALLGDGAKRPGGVFVMDKQESIRVKSEDPNP